MPEPSIVNEKVEQAVRILQELDIDAWLTFARETTETGDPVLPLILGAPVTWQSAFILTREGRRLAIVGRYEDEAVRSTGAWSEVISYVRSVREPLVQTLAELDPARLAVNFSTDDVKADGLSHGMYLLLREHLAGTPYGDRLISAEDVILALRGRKTAGELARLQRAIVTTEAIFVAVSNDVREGMTEAEVARLMRRLAAERNVQTAWDAAQCPIVTTGARSMVGHGIPSEELRVEAGGIFHLDFGVRQAEYCSDLQRVWYVPEAGETAPPAAVQRGFETVVAAIGAAAATLRPGVAGWQVDEAARRWILDAGYPEYQHATGHQVGRAAHDGGAVLGPRWPRYGRTPEYLAEPGQVYTLELGVENLDGRGYLGLEEMVLVTDTGCRWLSNRQTELPLVSDPSD